MDFSIILINFNSAPYVEPCLEHLRNQSFKGTTEIIVINNASSDGSLDILKRQKGITLINPGRNLGYSEGNNHGITKSCGKYVLCLNFDCLIERTFLENVFKAFESHSQAGMISGKLYKLTDMKPTMYLDSTGINFTTLVPADRGEWQYDKGQYDSETKIFGPSGAAGSYRRKALEDVVYKKTQYFDKQMFTYCEDIDLAWRLNLAGWKGLFLPDAIAYHERGATRKNSIWKKAGYYSIGFRNRLFTIFKNLRPEDIRGHFKKLLHQEWRFLLSSCGKSPVRWLATPYTLIGLAGLLLRPSFIAKRRFVHRNKKTNHLDLSLDVDFWQESYVKRKIKPTQIHTDSEEYVQLLIGEDGLQLSCKGFIDESWQSQVFFRGKLRENHGFIEINIPKLHQTNFKRLNLCLELEAKSDVTIYIEAVSLENQAGRTDWQVLSNGRITSNFDLCRMDMATGAENIKVWQKPWKSLRVHLTNRAGCEIIIHNFFIWTAKNLIR